MLRYIPKEEYAKLAPKIFEENRELLRRLAQCARRRSRAFSHSNW